MRASVCVISIYIYLLKKWIEITCGVEGGVLKKQVLLSGIYTVTQAQKAKAGLLFIETTFTLYFPLEHGAS